MKRFLLAAVIAASVSACGGVSLGKDGWTIDNTSSGGLICTYNGPITNCRNPGQIARTQAMLAEQAAARQKQQEAWVAARDTAIAKQNADRQAEIALESTPEYKAALAAKQISSCKQTLENAREGLARQHEIEQVSGVIDMGARRHYAEWIVSCSESIHQAWVDYKANGGTAKSIAALN
jgi:hypothetical protein